MAVEKTVTFHQVPPRRPGEADILTGDKENATQTVPPQNPSAEEFMQMGRLLATFGRMVPLLRISVDYTGSVATVQSLASVRTDVAALDLTLTHNGPGDVSIVWPADKYPAASGRPVGGTNRGTSAGRSCDTELIANGVRVRTADSLGPADLPFTVLVF